MHTSNLALPIVKEAGLSLSVKFHLVILGLAKTLLVGMNLMLVGLT